MTEDRFSEEEFDKTNHKERTFRRLDERIQEQPDVLATELNEIESNEESDDPSLTDEFAYNDLQCDSRGKLAEKVSR